MSMQLARKAFVQALGQTGIALIGATCTAVNGGKQYAHVYTVQMPNGTTAQVTQTLDARADHVAEAGAMAAAFVQQNAATLPPTATPTVAPIVTP